LGIKLFRAKVIATETHLRTMIETKPRPRAFAAPSTDTPVVETERLLYMVRDADDENPYAWYLDQCGVTLANFHYRKMSLLRDYDMAIREQPASSSFEAAFSLAPRRAHQSQATKIPLADRYDVVVCDPTQTRAIGAARGGESYIVQGPPGTGKSQTITNL